MRWKERGRGRGDWSEVKPPLAELDIHIYITEVVGKATATDLVDHLKKIEGLATNLC